MFSTQVIVVSVLLFFSLQFHRNQLKDGSISFVKCLQHGFLIGISVAIFGMLFFLIYTNYINPSYGAWLNEMYLQNWIARGLSESEIQKQLSTNNWLKTTNGIIYIFFFIIGLTTFFSIIPAIFISRPKRKSFTENLT